MEITWQSRKSPEKASNGGGHIALKVFHRQPWTEITLDPEEEIVYQAILHKRRCQETMQGLDLRL
jgi:hypothetical protein